MNCVFDNPIHANGCIFADPFVVLEVLSGGKPDSFSRIISFESETKSLQVVSEPVKITESNFGIQAEIDRFEGVIDVLQGQLSLIQAEIDLFEAREDIESQLRAEFLIRDTLKAGEFIDDLLLQIIQLRRIKRLRLDEEIILAILFGNE